MKITPVAIALTQVGQREEGGRNRGPMVDEYLRSVDLDPTKGGEKGYAWCCAFVYWCVREAWQRSMWENGQSGPAHLPIDRTAWVWDLHKNKERICPPKAGAVFTMSHSKDPKELAMHAHTGFIVSIEGNDAITVEGNTNVAGSREGDGVYLRRRAIKDLYRFLDVERAT